MGRSSFLTRWDRIHNPLKLLIFLLALFPPQNDAVAGSGSDKSALLEFRGSISDPHGFLRSWDSNTSSHCSWAGVFCGSGSRVVALNLTGRGNSSSCAIFGKLSSAVARLTELRVLSMPFNELSGTIPVEIWGMEKLEVLDLEGNSISGALPSEFTGLRSLKILNLGFNEITGGIPRSLSNFLNLRVLNLAGNRMDGTIPGFVGGFGDLNGLYLSFNQFRGSIPDEIGGLSSLLVLNLSFNSLQGPIPSTLGRLKDLKSLSLSANNLTGSIPASLRRLSSLEVLDLSSNSLSDQIPKSIKTLSNLTEQLPNISTIRRLGASQIDASSSSSNPKDENSNLNSIEIASITSAAAIISVLLALTFLILYTRRQNPGKSRVSMEVITFADVTGGPPLTFESVARNFNASNCIGSGGFGSTYKVEIAPGLLLAVKRLSVGRFQGIQQFHAEIKTLGKLRHPNLVTLIGYHASRAEMFLIYNYLPGGNLEKFIRERPSGALDWRVLHKIALDVSRALSYLHEQCVPRVLHRDVKPSNILLDEECNAYLSDFGLARLLGTSETHATTNVAGTFGYVAPEYAMTCRVSDKADVYSYGVVLLELLSDKKALDPSFSVYGNGFNIVAWAGMLLRKGRAEEFFAAGIWDAGPRDDLVEVLHLAAVCTADSISTRPTMKQVVLRLKQLR